MVGYTTGKIPRKKKVESYHGWIYLPGMAAKKKNPNSRHGKLADGTSQTSITMKKELLQKAKEAAASEGRSLSNWLEQLVKKSLILAVAGLAALHWHRSPRNWSAAALKQTAAAAWHKVSR